MEYTQNNLHILEPQYDANILEILTERRISNTNYTIQTLDVTTQTITLEDSNLYNLKWKLSKELNILQPHMLDIYKPFTDEGISLTYSNFLVNEETSLFYLPRKTIHITNIEIEFLIFGFEAKRINENQQIRELMYKSIGKFGWDNNIQNIEDIICETHYYSKSTKINVELPFDIQISILTRNINGDLWEEILPIIGSSFKTKFRTIFESL